MDLGLNGRTVFVTGASGGIGRAIAHAFATEGANVVVGYHAGEDRAREAAARAESLGVKALPLRIDLGDPESIDAAADRALTAFGTVDVLVNNAVEWPSFPAPGERFETAPPERMRRSLRANLEGPYLLARALTGQMRAQGWGRIIHVSTGLAVDGFAGSAPYTTPKSGLHGLTRTMSRELARAGVLTNVVMAGFVVGDRSLPEAMIDQAKAAAATGRLTEAEEVAALIVYLGSAANGHVTGELIRADGHFLVA
ncbi:SDR family NAD(P)-dependent oxidoreductase [Actinomadura sp. HBU206391]|uniref:SDR family NAD(P)-dependent oxidoreductase n=1 Tax=Actinomadura sp. HBU206391 TaxID=2731692 RepID=UPI001650860B|nr:SDR family oxidoreductase [Actinomadura sp. HBU206391]MBC6462150.1 SDR family oxidoreductase [Actinomadura sp. HBU206391]